MSLITCRIRHSVSQLSSSQAHFLIVLDSLVVDRQISALCALYTYLSGSGGKFIECFGTFANESN